MTDAHDILPGSLPRNWGWMLALGILLLLFGIVGLYSAVALTVASVLLFGALLLAGGIAQLIQTFRARGWRSIALHAAIALLYGLAGALVLYDPIAASLSLTIFIGVLLLATGLMRAIIGVQMRPKRAWVWVLAGGLASLLLGVLILLQWPVSGLVAIGLFVAIELLLAGWSCVFIALAMRPQAGDQVRG